MVNRLFRIGLAALFAAALAPAAPAWAQDDDEEEVDEDTDPCAGISPPCSDSDEDEGDSKDDDSGDELASGEGEGEGEGEGDGEGSGKGDDEGSSDDDDDDAVASADADATIESSPMSPTLGEGKIAVWAALQVGLSDGATGDPLSVEPDVWYGVNNKLTAGVVTSGHAVGGFWGGAGNGLCVGDGCLDKTFDNVGAEVLYGLKADSSFVFALDVGFHALAIDGLTLAGKVGGKGFWRSGQISVGFAPSVLIGVTDRAANKERLNLPVDLSYMLSQSLYVGVQTGISTPFEGAGDAYVVPVALGGLLMLSEKLMVTAAFSLDAVTSGAPEGAEAPGAIDTRSFSLALGYTM